MKTETSRRKFARKIAVLVLLGPLVWFVATPILKPWASRKADRRIAKWEQLHDGGCALMRARKYDEAEVSLRAAQSYAQKEFLFASSREGSSAFALGGVLLLQKRFDEARGYFERDLLIREEIDRGPSAPQCPALGRLVEVCLETGDFDAALDFAQRAVAIRDAQQHVSYSELVAALSDLARVYEKTKDYAAALPVRGRLVRLAERQRSEGALGLRTTYYREALVHNVLGDHVKAEELYKKSLSVFRDAIGADTKLLAHVVRDYGRLLESTNRSEKASNLRNTFGAFGKQSEAPALDP